MAATTDATASSENVYNFRFRHDHGHIGFEGSSQIRGTLGVATLGLQDLHKLLAGDLAPPQFLDATNLPGLKRRSGHCARRSGAGRKQHRGELGHPRHNFQSWSRVPSMYAGSKNDGTRRVEVDAGEQSCAGILHSSLSTGEWKPHFQRSRGSVRKPVVQFSQRWTARRVHRPPTHR
jgi:hypothetical protein